MEAKLKCGVVGIGTMGYRYAKVLKELRDIELVGIVDIREDILAKVSDELKVNFYTDAKKFYDVEKPDMVIIASPEKFHADNAVMALERDVHVHLEKPVSDNIEDCMKISEALKKSKSKMNIGYILRMLPQYAQIRKGVREGKFGEIIHFYARRNNGLSEGLRWAGRNDLATYLLCHDADILMWITGNKFIRVYAEQVAKTIKVNNTHDSIQAVLKCDDGSIGVIECSWVLPGKLGMDNKFEFELIGNKGAAFINNLASQCLTYYTEEGQTWHDMFFAPEIDGFTIGALKNEIERFIDSIVKDKPVMCTLEEGIEATKVSIATKMSLEKNAIVYLKDI